MRFGGTEIMLDEFREMLEDYDRDELPGVLFVSSECAPLSKTGGLADVVGTLPKALKALDVDARVITPYHSVIKDRYRDKVEHMFHFYVDLGWRHEYAGIEKLEINGTVIYLVDSEMYFGGPIYRGGDAEIEQYAFFQRAVLEAIPRLDFAPEIIHCNDWQTGMIPMLARTQYRGRMQEKMKYLLSIHNIAFQGWCSFDRCSDLLGVDSAYFTPEFAELNGCADFLKAGCVFADRINTVSPSYAEEIKTPYYGEGLQGILNARSAQLCGILNGIDTEAFNPETENNLPANYSADDLSGKARCKEALQRKMGLEICPDVPILSMVMRMTEQKGFELVMEQLDSMMQNENMQFVLLGSGDARYEEFMRGVLDRYRGRLGIYLGYNEELAHLIYAGSDLFLMPSRFEPCGLSQMIAMRYGCLPIVRETGGLRDSVIPYNRMTGEGDGFSFANFSSFEMRMVVHYAVETYRDENAREILIRHAMEKDFSFERSAKEYVRLYIGMLDGYHETAPAVSYDCRNEKCRNPFGAVVCGGSKKLSFEVINGRVRTAWLIVRGEGLENGEERYRMSRSGNRWNITYSAPVNPCTLEYVFRIESKCGDRYLRPDWTGLNGILSTEDGKGFGIVVYDRELGVPECFRHGAVCQVYADRLPELAGGRGVLARKLDSLEKKGVSCLHVNPMGEDEFSKDENCGEAYVPQRVLTADRLEKICSAARGRKIKLVLGCSLGNLMNRALAIAAVEFLSGARNAWSMAEFLAVQQMNCPETICPYVLNPLPSHVSPENVLVAEIMYAVPGIPCSDAFADRGMQNLDARLSKKRAESEALSSGRTFYSACSDSVLLILRYIPGGEAQCLIVNSGDLETDYSADFSARGFGRISGRIKARSAEMLAL